MIAALSALADAIDVPILDPGPNLVRPSRRAVWRQAGLVTGQGHPSDAALVLVTAPGACSVSLWFPSADRRTVLASERTPEALVVRLHELSLDHADVDRWLATMRSRA